MDKFFDIVFDHFKQEWAVIKQIFKAAPISAFCILALGAFLSWAVLKTKFALLRDENESLVSSRDGLAAELQKSLTEGKRLLVENDELRQRFGNAEFRLLISNVCLGAADQDTNRTSLVLSVRIVNSGAASVAVNWKLNVRLQDGKVLKGFAFAIAPEYTCVGRKITTVPLDLACATKKVELTESGHLGFVLNCGVNPALLSSAFVLSVEDARGKQFQHEQDLRDLLSR